MSANNPDQNCSLVLKKVPSEINTILAVNNHFSKYGKVVCIQVNFNGDAESALVTFSSHAEANDAYRSTDAVLDNRFIELLWHEPASQPVDLMPSDIAFEKIRIVFHLGRYRIPIAADADKPFLKPMTAYCKQAGLSMDSLTFRYDGNPVHPEDTPKLLRLEDGDTIDVESKHSLTSSPNTA